MDWQIRIPEDEELDRRDVKRLLLEYDLTPGAAFRQLIRRVQSGEIVLFNDTAKNARLHNGVKERAS